MSEVESVESVAEHPANGNCHPIKVLICKAHPSNTKAIQRALPRQETHYKSMKDFENKTLYCIAVRPQTIAQDSISGGSSKTDPQLTNKPQIRHKAFLKPVPPLQLQPASLPKPANRPISNSPIICVFSEEALRCFAARGSDGRANSIGIDVGNPSLW